MTLTYKLEHNDFLQHQLYLASKSPRIRKQRLTSWLLLSGSMLLLSLLFYQTGETLLFVCGLILAAVTLIFYPLYQSRHYKNHYSNFIADTYKKRFGQIASITFAESGIEAKDLTGESRINLTEIENVTETGNHFYLKLRTGVDIVIPKTKLDDVDRVRNELKQLCDRLNTDFIEDLNWKWK